ncbi:MAG: hypothetical protein ACC608_11645 [Anaerofustis sp.]|jgi:uncharacterized membrane protein YeaQ/YmgE (transglycosylase-associated protein family)
MKIDKKTKYYFAISVISLILWRVGILLRHTSFGNSLIVKQVLDIFPDFILCILIPFLILGLIRWIRIPKKETRLLYYIIFLLMIGSIIGEYALQQWIGTEFDIFDIIAAMIGLFATALIHNGIEIKVR